MQTKKQSIKEALTNTGIGMIIAFITNSIVLPLFGMPYEFGKFTLITIVYTLISVARNYVIRRMFNKNKTK